LSADSCVFSPQTDPFCSGTK